ncbi:39S ribosomal protein L28, mitochondrial [Chamberlinius hualienensis]
MASYAYPWKVARTFGIDSYRLFRMFPENHIFHRLPGHYKQQLIDWYDKTPAPVHYQPKTKKWVKNERTGEKKILQMIPIPLIYPNESNEGLWGGEGVIKGFKVGKGKGKKILYQFPIHRRPHVWVPTLKKMVFYSEILDKYMSIIVTERAVRLIDEAYGLDYYILKTDLVDLRSQLGFSLRRQMLKALINKDFYHNDPEKQQEVYDKYKQFIIPEDKVEWIGLTLTDALKKQKEIEDVAVLAEKPVKYRYRRELVEKLKQMELSAVKEEHQTSSDSWLKRLLPFSSADKSTNKDLN